MVLTLSRHLAFDFIGGVELQPSLATSQIAASDGHNFGSDFPKNITERHTTPPYEIVLLSFQHLRQTNPVIRVDNHTGRLLAVSGVSTFFCVGTS
jgi:hypothetical protein